MERGTFPAYCPVCMSEADADATPESGKVSVPHPERCCADVTAAVTIACWTDHVLCASCARHDHDPGG